LVFPVLVFILLAYGIYALLSALAGRKGSRLCARSPRWGYGWLGLAATAGVGLGLAVMLAYSSNQEKQTLKLEGFLGMVWADGWPDQVARRVEDTPIKSMPSGDQPMYALLDPASSHAKPAQGKIAPKPRPVRKPKMHKVQSPQAQAKDSKTVAQKAKNEQVAAKTKYRPPSKSRRLQQAAKDQGHELPYRKLSNSP
jgi:hypothetical protein